MVRLLSVFYFLFSFAALGAVTPSGVPSIGLGAMGTTVTPPVSSPAVVSLASISGTTGSYAVFSLYASGNFNATNFSTFYRDGVAYQVPTGKSAFCFNIRASASSGGVSFQLVSATTTIGFAQSSITGGVHQGGAVERYPLRVSTTANTLTYIPGIYVFKGSSWPGIQLGASFLYEISLDCYEQTAP